MALPNPWPTERAINLKVLSRLYSLMPTPLVTSIALPVYYSAATVEKLLPPVTGIRRQVSSLVVPLAKTNSATTTPCPCAAVTSKPPLFFFVKKFEQSLPSAATFASATHNLPARQTKLRVFLDKVLNQLMTPSSKSYLPTVVWMLPSLSTKTSLLTPQVFTSS